MGADEYVYLTLGQIAEYLFGLFGGACAGEIFHPYREICQTVPEGIEMLICEHCSRHEHRHLLAVCSGLESGAYGDLGLAEPHVAADQAVHRARILHILFHSGGGCKLIGSILIDKRGFQFMLQVAVGRETEPQLLLACRIQPDKVARNILELALGALFKLVPRSRPEFVDRRLNTLLAAVFGKFVQGMYAHEYTVVVLVYQLYHLLRGAVDLRAQQAAEAPHAMVHMHYVVARLYGTQLFQGKGEFA